MLRARRRLFVPLWFRYLAHTQVAMKWFRCAGAAPHVHILPRTFSVKQLTDPSCGAICDLVDAAGRGKLARVRELLHAGVDKDAPNEAGDMALFMAAQHGHASCVRLLLQRV